MFRGIFLHGRKIFRNNKRQYSFFPFPFGSNMYEKSLGYFPWYTQDIISGQEFSTLAMTFYKIRAASHPIINVAKEIVYLDNQFCHNPGLIFMLMLKFLWPTQSANFVSNNRLISQATDMIHFAFLIHNTFSQPKLNQRKDEEISKDLQHLISKLSVLAGDLLFTRASFCLSRIEIPPVIDIMSRAIIDLCLAHSRFTDEKSISNKDGIQDFLSYISWRYASLINRAITASYYVMMGSSEIDDKILQCVKLVTECRVLSHEHEHLKKYLHSSSNRNSTVEEYEGKKSKILKFYSGEKLLNDIISESEMCFIDKKKYLLKEYKSLSTSQSFKLLDSFISCR